MDLRVNCRNDKRNELGITQPRKAQLCGIEFMCLDDGQELGAREGLHLQPKRIFSKCKDGERIDRSTGRNVNGVYGRRNSPDSLRVARNNRTRKRTLDKRFR